MRVIGQAFLLIFSLLIVGSLVVTLSIIAIGSNVHPIVHWVVALIATGIVFWKVKNLRLRLWSFSTLVILSLLAIVLSKMWMFDYIHKHRSNVESQSSQQESQ